MMIEISQVPEIALHVKFIVDDCDQNIMKMSADQNIMMMNAES